MRIITKPTKNTKHYMTWQGTNHLGACHDALWQWIRNSQTSMDTEIIKRQINHILFSKEKTMNDKKNKANSAASDLSNASAYAREAERKLSSIGDKEGAKQAKEVFDKANKAKERVRELVDPGQKG